jgi:hypothetical protein
MFLLKLAHSVNAIPQVFLFRLFIVWMALLAASAVQGQSADVLPAPLYFIRDNDQVWRMEQDVATLTQITHEASPITHFDVSPVDGALAYVSDNDLIRADAMGEERTVLVDGITLVEPADTGEGYVERLNGQIRSPRWSPDGEQIAFAMGGVRVMPSAGGEPELLLPNSLSEVEGDPMIAFLSSTSYLPEVWSPDGMRLIVQVLMPPEQGGLAILNLADSSLTALTNPDDGMMANGYPSWSADSAFVYYSIANHFFTPGLWRADADTGESVTLVEGLDADGTYTLIAYPRELNEGWLYYFLTMTDQPDPSNLMSLTMHRAALDGLTNREALRTDSYILGEVVWADDASGAVIEAILPSVEIPPLLWLPANGSEAVELGISGYNLRWGVQ